MIELSLPSEGSINVVKKRLLALIGLAEPAAHVFGDWKAGIDSIYSPKTGLKLPVVTVRIGPARVVSRHYGRIWEGGGGGTPKSGDVGLFTFSAHCFASACTASGEEKYKHAHDLADKIVQYLATQNWNSTTHASHAIGDVFDMTARESEPKKGARKICRVIIEGTMMVKRVD